jgi:gluconate 5-dehydrogenase
VIDRPSVLERLFSLAGKTVLVTGGAGGIGRELAAGMAEAGAIVAVHDQDLDRLAEPVRRINAVGGEAVPFAAALDDPAACGRLIEQVHTRLGRLDVLINCAGTNRRMAIDDVTADDWDLLLAVNLRAVFLLSQAAHPIMKSQGGGKIINVGSLTSSVGLGTISVYGATKAAVAQLTKTMAVEWAEDNIQVNCIAPGFMLTPMTEGMWADPNTSRWMRDRIPLRRPGRPDELVGVALLLASAASSYVSGTLINVDGGVLAGGFWEPGEATSA